MGHCDQLVALFRDCCSLIEQYGCNTKKIEKCIEKFDKMFDEN
jgi:hypothetical protein